MGTGVGNKGWMAVLSVVGMTALPVALGVGLIDIPSAYAKGGDGGSGGSGSGGGGGSSSGGGSGGHGGSASGSGGGGSGGGSSSGGSSGGGRSSENRSASGSESRSVSYDRGREAEARGRAAEGETEARSREAEARGHAAEGEAVAHGRVAEGEAHRRGLDDMAQASTRAEIEKGMAATTSTARIDAYRRAVQEAARIEDPAARREALDAAVGVLSHR